ncbi:MAG TPA: hypothetical protein VFI27_21890 [candidate division Zixibacteria bacterium]|nr:hypothetical protein [candidate division Zixibacteria bacterium]
METPQLSPSSKIFQPTPEQLHRAESIRRFNRRFIYYPLAIIAIVAFSIVLTMVLYVVFANSTEYLVTLSAIADSVVILTVTISIILTTLVLGTIGAVYFQARKQGIAPIRQIQRFFWRLDMLTIKIQQSVAGFVPRLANPLIYLHSRFAYLKTLFIRMRRLFSRG